MPQETWGVSDERIAYELGVDLERLSKATDVIRARVQFLGPWERAITDADIQAALAWLTRAIDESLERH